MTTLQTAMAQARQRWLALAPRERGLVSIAALVVGAALLWWVGIAPALVTLRSAHSQRITAQAEWQQLNALAQEAQALKAQPALDAAQAQRALQAATATLGGTGTLNVLGGRATMALKNTPPAALLAWLTEVRANARAVPVEAQLSRNPAAGAVWTGTVVLALPGGAP